MENACHSLVHRRWAELHTCSSAGLELELALGVAAGGLPPAAVPVLLAPRAPACDSLGVNAVYESQCQQSHSVSKTYHAKKAPNVRC